MIKNKRILVVGINSFIAQALFRKWWNNNIVYRRHHNGKLLNRDTDLIVNFACSSNPSATNGLSILSANSTLMFRLLKYAVKNKSVFIQISSTAVNERRDEYAVGKMFSEALALRYSIDFGIDVRIVRLRHTYGQGMQLNDGRSHTNIIGSAVRDGIVQYLGDGKSIRTFTHIDDVISGIDRVAEKGVSKGIYEVVNPEGTVSIKEFAEMVGRLTGCPVNHTGVIENTISSAPDITSCLEIGWKPKISLEQGLRKTIYENIYR